MNITEKMQEYFKNTPRDQVLKDWAKTAKYDYVGPTVEQFLIYSIRVGRKIRLGRQISRAKIKRYSLPGWYRYVPSRDSFYRQMYNTPDPYPIKCMTFHLDALPDEILAKMKANQEQTNLKIKQPAQEHPDLPAYFSDYDCVNHLHKVRSGYYVRDKGWNHGVEKTCNPPTKEGYYHDEYMSKYKLALSGLPF